MVVGAALTFQQSVHEAPDCVTSAGTKQYSTDQHGNHLHCDAKPSLRLSSTVLQPLNLSHGC